MIWWLLFGMAVITFGNRYAFLARSIRWQPNLRLQRLLEYSVYAVLTAIWVPIVSTADAERVPAYVLGAAVAALLTMFRLPSLLVVLLSTAVFFVYSYMG